MTSPTPKGVAEKTEGTSPITSPTLDFKLLNLVDPPASFQNETSPLPLTSPPDDYSYSFETNNSFKNRSSRKALVQKHLNTFVDDSDCEAKDLEYNDSIDIDNTSMFMRAHSQLLKAAPSSLALDFDNLHLDSPSKTSISLSNEVDKLNKQITNYRIQLRIVSQFTRNLINKYSPASENDIFSKLQAESHTFTALQCEECQFKEKELLEVKGDMERLNAHLKEVSALLSEEQESKQTLEDDVSEVLQVLSPWGKSLIESVEAVLRDFAEKEDHYVSTIENLQMQSFDSEKVKEVLLLVEDVQRELDLALRAKEDISALLDRETKGIDGLEKEIVDLVDELAAKNEQLSKSQNPESKELDFLKEEHKNQKSSLQQLHYNLQTTERDHIFKMSQLQEDLDLAVQKQRTISSEKTKLKYENDNLNRQLTALRNSRGNSISDDWTGNYLDIIRMDLSTCSSFMKIFQKILDNKSLSQANDKVRELSENVENRGNHRRIKDLHETIFKYYCSAVGTIVNEHVHLLIESSETHSKDQKLIDELNETIHTLRAEQNDEETIYQGTPTRQRQNSPRTELRLDELTRRWKTEREARYYESEQSKKRLRELELENEMLKKELAQVDLRSV